MAFVLALRISLSRPQLRHVTQVADALITTEGSTTLSGLYRNIVGNPCPKAAADTLRAAHHRAHSLLRVGEQVEEKNEATWDGGF